MGRHVASRPSAAHGSSRWSFGSTNLRGNPVIKRDPNRAQRDAIHYRDGQNIEEQMHMGADEGLSDEEIHLKARALELGRYFPIRERFWLDRLDGCREHNVIFICGEAHIESFTELVDREDIRFRIVERGIGVTHGEHEDFRRIVEYLGAHPELRKG